MFIEVFDAQMLLRVHTAAAKTAIDTAHASQPMARCGPVKPGTGGQLFAGASEYYHRAAVA